MADWDVIAKHRLTEDWATMRSAYLPLNQAMRRTVEYLEKNNESFSDLLVLARERLEGTLKNLTALCNRRSPWVRLEAIRNLRVLATGLRGRGQRRSARPAALPVRAERAADRTSGRTPRPKRGCRTTWSSRARSRLLVRLRLLCGGHAQRPAPRTIRPISYARQGSRGWCGRWTRSSPGRSTSSRTISRAIDTRCPRPPRSRRSRTSGYRWWTSLGVRCDAGTISLEDRAAGLFGALDLKHPRSELIRSAPPLLLLGASLFPSSSGRCACALVAQPVLERGHEAPGVRDGGGCRAQHALRPRRPRTLSKGGVIRKPGRATAAIRSRLRSRSRERRYAAIESSTRWTELLGGLALTDSRRRPRCITKMRWLLLPESAGAMK